MSLLGIISQFANAGGGIDVEEPPTVQIIAEGDSVTAYPPTWMSYLETALNDPATYVSFANFAVSGESIFNGMNTPESIREIVDARLLSCDIQILIIYAGINDVQNDASAASVYARLKHLVSLYEGQGFKIIVCTLTASKATIWENTPGKYESMFVASEGFNALLRDGWENDIGADVLLDVVSDPLFGGFMTPNTSDYFIHGIDNLHWSELGREVFAETFAMPGVELAVSGVKGVIEYIP